MQKLTKTYENLWKFMQIMKVYGGCVYYESLCLKKFPDDYHSIIPNEHIISISD